MSLLLREVLRLHGGGSGIHDDVEVRNDLDAKDAFQKSNIKAQKQVRRNGRRRSRLATANDASSGKNSVHNMLNISKAILGKSRTI